MLDADIRGAIVEALEHLPPSSQKEVLDYVLRLADQGQSTPGTPFEQLKHLVATLPAAAADDMERAIEEHCERIDAGNWGAI